MQGRFVSTVLAKYPGLRRFRNMFARARNTASAFRHSDPVLAYRWNRVPNFGDLTNPILIEAISGRRAVRFGDAFNLRRQRSVMATGSVLEHLPIDEVTVWGSGFISSSSSFHCSHLNDRNKCGAKSLAVGGPLTRAKALDQGVDCTEVYGDPALLIPKFMIPSQKKSCHLQ